MTLPNEVFSAFAFIAFLLCIIACPWQLTSWNTGACLYVFWTSLGCLNSFINSVVWNHSIINKAPVWCDISSKLILGISIGIPTASFCICRRLYIISSLKSFTISKAEARLTIIVDSLIGLGIPVLIMSLHYIVQGHRFDLFEDVGCGPAVYFTWQSYLVVSSPPIFIGLVSAVYAVLNIRQFYTMRNRLNTERPQNNITTTMYVRFVCLSSIEVLCTVPLATFFLVYGATVLGFRFPWISWADTHYNFSRVGFVSASMWRGSRLELTLELNRWLNVICAFIFFAFFGYTEESKKTYRHVFETLARRFGFQWSPTPNQLPAIHFKPMENTSQGSLDSFTDANVSNYSLGVYGNEKEKFDEDSTYIPSLPTHVVTMPQPAPDPQTDAAETHSSLHDPSRHLSLSVIPPPKAHVRPRSTVPTVDQCSTQGINIV